MNQFEHSNKLIALLPAVAAHGMQSFDRLITLAQCAFNVQKLHGDVCEFGCNAGGTARWLRKLHYQSGIEAWHEGKAGDLGWGIFAG